jgi:hypothetical protein
MNNFDETGIKPGITKTIKVPKTIAMKCKDDKCSSNEVIEVTSPVSMESVGVPHFRTYQCVKCKSAWTVSTGGYVSF